ncbi:MFS transporter, partial [Modestobacter versicolor]
MQRGRRAGAAALPVLLLAGVLLVALNMRGPLVAIAPVTDDLRRDLAVGAGTIGLLTSIPVLCFGLAAPLASLLIARTGVHRAVLVSMAGVLAGTLLRSLGSPAAAIAGTVVIGLAITVANVVVPVVIGRDFPGATNVVTAAYTAALNLGSTLTSALTAPLAELVGWQAALAAWGLLVAVAAAVWTTAL